MKIHLLQMSCRCPSHAKERGVSGLAAAVATRGAGSSVMRLPLDAIVIALLFRSSTYQPMEAAKLRCHMDPTGTGAMPKITVERIVRATT